jgi:hypothetical protein
MKVYGGEVMNDKAIVLSVVLSAAVIGVIFKSVDMSMSFSSALFLVTIGLIVYGIGHKMFTSIGNSKNKDI